jgi:hypothetical protein
MSRCRLAVSISDNDQMQERASNLEDIFTIREATGVGTHSSELITS